MKRASAGAPSSAYWPGDLKFLFHIKKSHLFTVPRLHPLPGTVAAEEQTGGPGQDLDLSDEDFDEDSRDDDECSLKSYTRGGRCLQCHVKRIEEESLFDSESENSEDYPIQDPQDFEGHDADGEFPIQYPEPHDLDGESCA